jgi:hypothetical protein
VDPNFNSSQNEFLWTLLANPANDTHLYANDLQRLVNDFPQSGILHALLAQAGGEANLRQASVYFNTKALYKLINAPSSFPDVPAEKIIVQSGLRVKIQTPPEELTEAEETVVGEVDQHLADMPTFSNHEVIEADPELKAYSEDNLPLIEEETTLVSDNSETVHDLATDVSEIHENIAVDEPVEDINEVYEEIQPAEEQFTQLVHETEPKDDFAAPGNVSHTKEQMQAEHHAIELPEQTSGKEIGDEVFDEIISIEDIHIEPETHHSEAALPEEVKLSEEEITPATTAVTTEPEQKENAIPSADFFRFGNSFSEQGTAADLENEPVEMFEDEQDTDEINTETEQQELSKYHDEQMPYTFLWWLDKTRKEHVGVFQPYVKPAKTGNENGANTAVNELQQQYFENIFHIASVEELDKNTAQQTVPFEMKSKEQAIIERFIQEDPQIKPQSSDKLDNENKAKRSSEDQDELVTETLAAIYSEQMLYHKAIAAYKKLMLKFPEKSSYFAAKIEQLEKKTN